MVNKKAYLDYLKSEQWANIRCDLIQIHGSICQRCSKKTKYLQVHHLTYDNLFHEEPADLILLCGDCHKKEHGIKKKKKKIKYKPYVGINIPYARKIINTKLKTKTKVRTWYKLGNVLNAHFGGPKHPNKKAAREAVKKYIRDLGYQA